MRKYYAAAIVILLAASPAWAINFSQELKNADGTAPKVAEGQKPPTLAGICETALISTYKDEQDASGKETITPTEKFHRGRLATKIADAGDKDITLPPEDLVLLKKLIGRAYGALIVYQAYQMIGVSPDDAK